MFNDNEILLKIIDEQAEAEGFCGKVKQLAGEHTQKFVVLESWAHVTDQKISYMTNVVNDVAVKQNLVIERLNQLLPVLKSLTEAVNNQGSAISRIEDFIIHKVSHTH